MGDDYYYRHLQMCRLVYVFTTYSFFVEKFFKSYDLPLIPDPQINIWNHPLSITIKLNLEIYIDNTFRQYSDQHQFRHCYNFVLRAIYCMFTCNLTIVLVIPEQNCKPNQKQDNPMKLIDSIKFWTSANGLVYNIDSFYQHTVA